MLQYFHNLPHMLQHMLQHMLKHMCALSMIPSKNSPLAKSGLRIIVGPLVKHLETFFSNNVKHKKFSTCQKWS